jgi:purine-nucleoside phosphorylase
MRRAGSGARDDAEGVAVFLRGWLGGSRPRWGIVLGSGLGVIAASLDRARAIPLTEIPGMPVSRVAGHEGVVWCGGWGKEDVLVFEGRTHLYEGRGCDQVTRPVRVMARLGVGSVILTNAAGSLDRGIPPGALVRACDVIDLFFRRIRGDRASAPGAVLDAGLGGTIDAAARSLGIDLRRGILAGLIGPAYETAAEVRLLRRVGADVAGMSTVPEAFAARRVGMRVAVVSLVTNHATGVGDSVRLTHEDVVERAVVGAEDLGRLLRETIAPRA